MAVGLERSSQVLNAEPIDLALYRRALELHGRIRRINPGSTETIKDVYKAVLQFEANAAESNKHGRTKIHTPKATT